MSTDAPVVKKKKGRKEYPYRAGIGKHDMRANWKINWEEVEHRFITEDRRPSLSTLADEYGVSRVVMYRHSLNGDWMKKRTKHWDGVHKEVMKELRDDAIDRAISRVKNLRSMTDRLITKLGRKGKLDEMQTTDLVRLMQAETMAVGELKDNGSDEYEEVNEVVEQQILQIKTISRKRGKSFNENLLNAFGRLGIASSGENGEAAGDGTGPTRENVKVRNQLP